MNLSEFDGKHVRIKSTFGNIYTGLADYANSEFLECEYGENEDGVFIEDFLIYNSQIESIEAIEVHGTVELRTENLTLRRYCMDDAERLYERFGKDPEMFRYTGWNPYITPEMAQETVRRFIKSYGDDRAYSWVLDVDDIVVGTIGAYDDKADQIEVGFSIDRNWQGRGFATEALKKVLKYLTENEDFSRVTAWCADENKASRRVLEKSGMRFVGTETGTLIVEDREYDKLIYEYRKPD